ncbi:MAG: hypothetical protein KBD56_07840 [Candidatus Eisenbacteria bacterium]|nr:hypothetical protein [Candidatus Eisenbacteria bacterium]
MIASIRLARVALLLAALAFAVEGVASAPAYTQGDYLFILTRELPGAGGAFSLMDMNQPWQHDNNYGAAHEDAVAFFYEGLIYVVNRAGADNIRVIDPALNFQTIRQFSVGTGSNPQEICFVEAGRAFVTRYDDNELWEIDPRTGQHTDTIDLAPLADADGLPEMHAMAIHGGFLYVTLERLNRDSWMPEPPSYLAVIDLADNSLVDMDPALPGMQGFPLQATNPYSGIVIDPLTGDFLIGETGDYGVLDGGIERFDPGLRVSLGMAIGEAELGGDLNAWKTANGDDGFAVVMTPFPESHTNVVAFTLRSGENQGTIASSSEYAYADLHVDVPRGQLFVADRSYANPGIRVYDLETHAQLSAGVIPVGLYPLDLLGVPGPHSDVVESDLPRALRVDAFPQPAFGPVTIRVRTASDHAVTDPGVSVRILDSSGRVVADLLQRAGNRDVLIQWNGCDHHLRRAPGGVYWVEARALGQTAATKLLIVE